MGLRQTHPGCSIYVAVLTGKILDPLPISNQLVLSLIPLKDFWGMAIPDLSAMYSLWYS